MRRGFFTYKWISYLLLAIAVIAVYKTFDNLGNVFVYILLFIGMLKPFAIGLIIAYLLYAPSKNLETLLRKLRFRRIRRIARPLSVLAVILAAILVITALLSFVMPTLVANVIEFGKQIPGIYAEVEKELRAVKLDPFIAQFIPVDELLKNISVANITTDQITAFGQYLINFVSNSVMGIASGLVTAFMAIVIAIYMLLSRDTIFQTMRRLMTTLFSENVYERISDYVRRINKIFYGFIYGQLLDAMILGTMATIVLTVINAPFPPLAGVFLALSNLVPYFGPIIGIVIVVAMIVLQQGLWQGLIAIVVLIILQQIDANVIGPRIVGQSVGLKPLWIIFAITIAGGMFGFIGIIVSVPVFAVIRILLIDLFAYFEKIQDRRRSNRNKDGNDKQQLE